MEVLRIYMLTIVLLVNLQCLFSDNTPLNCSDTTRLCTSFLAFKPNPDQTLAIIQSMFDVLPQDVTVEGNAFGYLFIRKNCSCSASIKKYLTNTTFTVRKDQGLVYEMVMEAYSGLSFMPNSTRKARYGSVVSLHLFCGCSNRLWNYLMTYVMQDGDTVDSLASRFGVSMDNIESVNGITNPDNVSVGAVYYIPLNSENQAHHKTHLPYGWIIGSLGVGLVLILAAILTYISFKSSSWCALTPGIRSKDPDGKTSHKFHILRTTSFCCTSGRSISCNSENLKPNNGQSNNRQINIPKAMETDVFDMEKPVVFTYEEIHSSTDGFSDSNLLGHGTYGSVYHGFLRDQVVAIKRMTATKTKEFMAEMKVLCKVHHTNLVELIGFAATKDELFLIYEYAQKGSLRSHLHDPQNKGHTSLSWIVRVQIALDAARGLEYIHEHTKTHYVHRDIKTSNILLDSAFRAKISDFGLAKLVGRAGEGEASATRVVGTFGYLAPEYLTDGLATAKSDVYAFGVVLFESISGKEAITRTEGLVMKNPERRSLVSIMLAALKNSPNSMSMSSLKDCIDPNLMDLYPHDCVYKMAMLAKQCVDDDPILRPDMKQVVISLSQILLSSVEWEATLAGNSQVFSGLVQGR
ncbi:lysM domain receptor-like kinase 3 isoform X2 [Macadamia integrifolia]|uniref:lysM domain receptor-like kinase 3 isoform X2 n=1 Tax=Macadamia integrifolia TaxID=60698 RepID=UPI001C4F6E49|nr:lysM domain receptor-like kinase 3 isoform X2 [Macadamia integrifolia]